MKSMSPRMHRTTVDIELEAFESARTALGTSGFKETVNAALRRAARQVALDEAAELVRRGGLNLATPEDVDRLRAPRPRR